MALIGRLTLGSQPGQEPLTAVPDMVLRLEDIRRTDEDLWRVIFWASGDDYGAYEDALASEPTIETFQRLTDLGDRRLYSTTFAAAVRGDVLHSVAVEHDVTLIDVTMTAERLRYLARFPSREALASLRAAARERGMEFRLEQLYDEAAAANDGGVTSRYGVTSAQREVLAAALEAGYFDVPRGTTLESVAVDLDVSTSAVSRSLRRGLRNLLRATLATEPDT